MQQNEVMLYFGGKCFFAGEKLYEFLFIEYACNKI